MFVFRIHMCFYNIMLKKHSPNRPNETKKKLKKRSILLELPGEPPSLLGERRAIQHTLGEPPSPSLGEPLTLLGVGKTAMLQIASECFRMHEKAPECIRMLQIA